MKKTILMFAIVSTLTAGAAVAGDNQSASATNGSFANGITYFDLGPVNKVSSTLQENETLSYNGITVFNLAKAGDRRARTPEGKQLAGTFNGITML